MMRWINRNVGPEGFACLLGLGLIVLSIIIAIFVIYALGTAILDVLRMLSAPFSGVSR